MSIANLPFAARSSMYSELSSANSVIEKFVYRGLKKNENRLQTVDKKLFSPEGGRIAISANERIAEFLNFAIQAKFAYVNKLKTKIVCMPCLPVPICIRRRLPVENFPQHKSRGKSALLQKRKQLTSGKKHI